MNASNDDGPEEAHDLVGGDISMELVNTASGRSSPEGMRDTLREYADLVAWSERIGLAGPERARRLRAVAAENPDAAADVLERARALREVIYRVFTTERPAAGDLDLLGRAVAEASARRRLVRDAGRVDFVWPETDDPGQLLWPVALSAAELLTSDERSRVKECAGNHCNWLFVDQSRNRSRRWCDMRECGNRAKARRFQARKKRRGKRS